MEIKLIENKDFLQLVELNFEMYKNLKGSNMLSPFHATKNLMMQIDKAAGFTAVGLYDDDVLLGAVTGYEQESGVFYFSGIILTIKSTEWTQRLIEYCFDNIKERGYISWEADATNDNIASILQKYDATPKFTRYHKEF